MGNREKPHTNPLILHVSASLTNTETRVRQRCLHLCDRTRIGVHNFMEHEHDLPMPSCATMPAGANMQKTESPCIDFC